MDEKQEKPRKKIQIDHVNVRMSISLLVLRLIITDMITTGIIIIVLFLFSQSNLTNIFNVNSNIYGFVAFIVLTIFETLLTIFIVLQWLCEYYEISPYAVSHKRGVIFKKEDRYGLHNIKQVVLIQGVFGKFFNYGTLTLFDWRLDTCAVMYSIHNPHRYVRILEELLPNVDEHKSIIRDEIFTQRDEVYKDTQSG